MEAAAVLAAAADPASHAMSGPRDPAELLDVDVDELTCAAAFVAVGRLGRCQPREPPETGALQDDATRSAGVEAGIRRGREERSARPASPSERQRPSHFHPVRSLTPPAAAAAA